MDDKMFKLYILAIIRYEKIFKNTVIEDDQLYPKNWNGDTNYERKIKILSESIEYNKLIKDTNSYKDYINNFE